MTANDHSIDPAQVLSEHLERAEPDLLRCLLKMFVETLMSGDADAVCGTPYGARSAERVNSRNGCRARDWDTRAATALVRAWRFGRLTPSTAASARSQARHGDRRAQFEADASLNSRADRGWASNVWRIASRAHECGDV